MAKSILVAIHNHTLTVFGFLMTSPNYIHSDQVVEDFFIQINTIPLRGRGPPGSSRTAVPSAQRTAEPPTTALSFTRYPVAAQGNFTIFTHYPGKSVKIIL